MAIKSGVIEPVVKALQMFECIAVKGHEVSLTQIACELKLPKTTASRHLETLVAAGFLARDEASRRYRVAARFRAIADADARLDALRQSALPIMAELRDALGEAVNLGLRGSRHVVYLEILSGRRPTRMQARVGGRDLIHTTALGKAMLAFLPPAEVNAILGSQLPQVTARTVTEIGELKAELKMVARRGYARERGENEDDFMCIGAPIFDEHEQPSAAISVTALQRRMARGSSADITQQVCDAAARIGVAWRSRMAPTPADIVAGVSASP